VVHASLDVGEREIAAAEAIRERFVVESQLVENGRMQVVYRNGIVEHFLILGLRHIENRIALIIQRRGPFEVRLQADERRCANVSRESNEDESRFISGSRRRHQGTSDASTSEGTTSSAEAADARIPHQRNERKKVS
jgi:hypothetical protein